MRTRERLDQPKCSRITFNDDASTLGVDTPVGVSIRRHYGALRRANLREVAEVDLGANVQWAVWDDVQEAYRQVEEIRGVADAKATEIYARAYNQSPEAVAFYEFTRTMQSYKSIIAENTTLVLSTNSNLFKFLKGMAPDSDVVPAPRSGDNR